MLTGLTVGAEDGAVYSTTFDGGVYKYRLRPGGQMQLEAATTSEPTF